MRVTVWGLVSIAVVISAAGCGGGGGVASGIVATGGSTMSAPLPDAMTGTWTVRSLGLPNDQMVVQSDGQVLVNADAASRSTGGTKIGTATSDGTLNLSGQWSVSGSSYSISGSGTIDTSAGAVSVRATVQKGSAVVQQDAVVRGTKGAVSGDFESPPPPPVFTSESNSAASQSQYNAPPPPPNFD